MFRINDDDDDDDLDSKERTVLGGAKARGDGVNDG